MGASLCVRHVAGQPDQPRPRLHRYVDPVVGPAHQLEKPRSAPGFDSQCVRFLRADTSYVCRAPGVIGAAARNQARISGALCRSDYVLLLSAQKEEALKDEGGDEN